MKTLRQLLLPIVLVFCTSTLQAIAQNEPDITEYLKRIERGEREKVRTEIQRLKERFPNNTGVLFLEGAVQEDGDKASKIYETLVDQHPKSEWTDDALFRLYQYYSALGLHKTASNKLDQLRNEYPDSPYVASLPRIVAGAQRDVGRPSEKTSGAAQPSVSERNRTEPPAATRSEPQRTVPVPPKSERDMSARSEPSKPVVRPSSQEPTAEFPFVLQAGAFGDIVNARQLEQRLKNAGYKTRIVRTGVGSRILHRIWILSFPSREKADQEAAKINTRLKIQTIVIDTRRR